MAGTKEFVMTPKLYASLTRRGMDLRCKCTIKCDGEECNAMIQIWDSVVSKPSKMGRKYYIKEHYEKMEIDLNGHDKT